MTGASSSTSTASASAGSEARGKASTVGKGQVICKNCRTGKDVAPLAIPYVFLYLVNELAAMNIRITLQVQ